MSELKDIDLEYIARYNESPWELWMNDKVEVKHSTFYKTFHSDTWSTSHQPTPFTHVITSP